MAGHAPSFPITVDERASSFLAGTLSRDAWTHPAHLLVCQNLLETASVAEVLADLRVRIPAHNERVGILPDHGGYHETVTRYFVEAVAAATATGPVTMATLLADPRCQRGAPLRHWSAPLLESETARSTWVVPDLDPLPWT